MPKIDIALVDMDAQVNLSSEDIPRCSGGSSSKRRKMTSSSPHITNLPEGIFEHVAKYLAAPSIICAAAFTASSKKFYLVSNRSKERVVEGIHCKVKFLYTRRDILDFGDVENSLAWKISDDDLAAMLVCINAVSNIKILRLTGCVSINGQGLAPLRGSAVLKEIDLSHETGTGFSFGCLVVSCSSGNLCMGCVSCSYCGDQFCDNCSLVNMCECWDGPRCDDCAVRAGTPDCCGETIAATACEECIGFIQCEGCSKSNFLRCINEKEYDVEC